MRLPKIFGSDGFILILVLGVLNILVVLALTFMMRSRTTATLSRNHLLIVNARLLARSGIEVAHEKVMSHLRNDPSEPVTPDSLRGTFSLPVVSLGPHAVNWNARDLSGGINVNDGIRAGALELGGAYVANAVDPWPGGGEDLSALINLRLRRLLNAYGDALKFVVEIGWPDHLPAGPPAGANYGLPFVFSSTDAGNRHTSMPGRDSGGSPLTVASQIAQSSTALGDRILAARPRLGYASTATIRDAVESWAADILDGPKLSAFLGGRRLFDIVSGDFTTTSWEDAQFFRMTDEIGRDADGDGRTDFPNDPLESRIVDGGGNRLYRRLEDDPPDLSDLWRPHSVAVLNLNAASNLVRGAVMYAPVNVSYVAEGVEAFYRNHPSASNPYPKMSNSAKMVNHWPLLGVGGVVFEAARMRENGFPAAGYSGSDPNFPVVQRNRLMSLRDALVMAQAYGDAVSGSQRPDSFEGFAKFLRDARANNQELERADPITPGTLNHKAFFRGLRSFEQHYLEVTLPGLFACTRRLPGWLHAPIALLSPYVQEGGTGPNNNQPAQPAHFFADVASDMALRSAEDFVFRWQHPKVDFLPTGDFELVALAHLEEIPGSVSSHGIRATFRLFEKSVARTQEDFEALTDPATSPTILISPEPTGVAPHPYLGVVGLRDRASQFADGSNAIQCRLDFDGDLNPGLGSTVAPVNADADPDLSSGVPTPELAGSNPEGPGVSVFAPGAAGSDLSPFGGLSFSSRGHGPHASGTFNDSLYLRPFPSTMTNLGDHALRGYVSLWARVPSGYVFYGQNHTVFTLTMWDRAWIAPYGTSTWPLLPGVLQERLRPVQVQALLTAPSKFRSPEGYTVPGGVNPNLFGMSMERAIGLRSSIHPAHPQYYTSDPYPLLQPVLYNSGGELTANAQKMMGYPGDLYYYHLNNGSFYKAFTATSANASETIEKLTTRFYEPHKSQAYRHRAGSWVRWVFRWDFSRPDWPTYGNPPTNENAAKLEKNILLPAPHDATSPATAIENHGSSWQEQWGGRYSPKSMLVFGEEAWYVNSSAAAQSSDLVVGGALTPAGSFDNGRYVPIKRFNSTLDNIVVEMGDIPSSFRLPASPPFITSSKALHQAVEAIGGFESVRYDVTSTPSWVIDPGLGEKDRFLTVGARIYDVPFSPQWGTSPQDYTSWTVKSPAVEVALVESGAPVGEVAAAAPILEGGISIKSLAWKSFEAHPAASDTRLRLRYLDSDPNGDPMGPTLVDIPWIQEVHWRYFPAGGSRILGWDEN